MIISSFDIILLLGSLQGFILATLLWISRKGNRLSNRLLAGLIGILALASLAVGNPSSNVWVRHAIDLLPFFMIMSLGPLIYFYVQSVLDPTFRLSRAERWHFYPVLLDWGAPLMGWTFILGALSGIFNPQDGPSWGYVMDEYNTYVDIPRWISVTIYLGLTQQFLAKQSATSAHANKVGVFIGEESGGAYEGGNGSSFINLELPKSGIQVSTPLVYYNNGVLTPKQKGRGTMPDHYVPLQLSDLLVNSSPQMRYVAELIRSVPRP